MKTGAALSLVAIVGLVAACGPVESAVVISDADEAVRSARVAGAEEAAPYEFTSAELYLDKAREEQGYADYQTAVGFARTARKQAREAYRKAREAVREGSGAAPQRPDGGPDAASDDVPRASH